MKVYPQRFYKDGINFRFEINGDWFNIRFAGNPLIVIKQLYKDAGGEDFHRVYETAKTKPEELTPDEKQKLQFAIATTEVFLRALSNASNSPLVVYTSYGDNQEG